MLYASGRPSWMSVGLVATAAMSCLLGAAAQAAADAFERLPEIEAPGRQIGWPRKGTLEAFTFAVENAKPMVVVFGSAGSGYTQKLAELVIPCPHINQLAGAAVFVYGPPQADEYARRMALRLKLTEFPTISVIAPRTDRLTELYRMEGFFDAETIANDLRKAIEGGGYWPKGLAVPAALPRNPLAYGGKACNAEAARRLGFPAR